jgi:heme-degrading monooxygenase HmoA
MYVVMNRIEVEPERAEMFEQHFAGSMNTTLGAVPGLVRSTLLRPTKPGDPYVAEIVFDTQESFQGWLHSDSFKAAHGHGPGEGEGGGPNVVAYEVVNEVVPGA